MRAVWGIYQAVLGQITVTWSKTINQICGFDHPFMFAFLLWSPPCCGGGLLPMQNPNTLHYGQKP